MKVNWKNNSPELVAALEALMAARPVQKKAMFAGISYFVNKNMFSGLHQDRFFVRLPETECAALLKKHPEIGPFEPVAGHAMKGYVSLPGDWLAKSGFVSKLIDASLAYARGLKKK